MFQVSLVNTTLFLSVFLLTNLKILPGYVRFNFSRYVLGIEALKEYELGFESKCKLVWW